MQISEEIINKIHRRDRQACEFLYKTYAPVCMGICLRYSRNRADAHDMLQEGFLVVYKNIRTYSFKGSFEGWIKKVIFHQSINYIRKYYKLAPANVEVENLSVYAAQGDPFDESHILKVINEIPEKYRIIFNLCAVDNYTHKEVAAMLNIEVATSRSQFLRARNMIKDRLRSYEAFDNKKLAQ